jgi:hypothetical protein
MINGYDQWKTASPYDDEPDMRDIREYTVNTDPYGILEYCIGSADDFICFDYQTFPEHGTCILHAVLNSETGHFIENFASPEVFFYDDPDGNTNALEAAKELVLEALEWCAMNRVQHDSEGWNQDVYYFIRTIESLTKTEGRLSHAERFKGAHYE